MSTKSTYLSETRYHKSSWIDIKDVIDRFALAGGLRYRKEPNKMSTKSRYLSGNENGNEPYTFDKLSQNAQRIVIQAWKNGMSVSQYFQEVLNRTTPAWAFAIDIGYPIICMTRYGEQYPCQGIIDDALNNESEMPTEQETYPENHKPLHDIGREVKREISTNQTLPTHNDSRESLSYIETSQAGIKTPTAKLFVVTAIIGSLMWWYKSNNNNEKE